MTATMPRQTAQTAAERRAIANTRPGYATYDVTQPGNPSWWARDFQTGQRPPVRHAAAPTTRHAHPSIPKPATTHTAAPHVTRWRWWHRWTRRTA